MSSFDSSLGTVGRITAASVQRGVESVTLHRSVGLSRVSEQLAGSRPFHENLTIVQHEGSMESHGLRYRVDHLEIDCHGMSATHVDALHHIELADRPGSVPGGESLLRWAASGIVTRAVIFDIPAFRGTEWVEVGDPVSRQELEDIDRRGDAASLRPGDAVLLYMGRDRFEAAGYRYLPGSATDQRPGLARSGGEWIVERGASVLCWDFQDAIDDDQPGMQIHRLIAQNGLALVDNCDLGDLAESLRAADRRDCLLVIAPLRIVGLTGSAVNPIAIF